MRYVIDASVAVKWLVDERGSDAAQELLAREAELHAPRLMASEVANALWCKARRGEIDSILAGTLATGIPDMPVQWSNDETITADAVRLSLSLNHPVYDCIYLALAYRRNAVILTADHKFANTLVTSTHSQAVLTLTEYARTDNH